MRKYWLWLRKKRSPVAMRRRNACDKAFLAVIKAVDQLLIKHGYPEPERHGERFAYLRELESKVPEVGGADLMRRSGKKYVFIFKGVKIRHRDIRIVRGSR